MRDFGEYGKRMKAPKKPSRSVSIAEQSEVITKHHDGVEVSKSSVDLRNGANASIADGSKQARFHRERRNVDCNHVVTASLQVQRNSPRATTHVKHCSTDLAHGALFSGRPLFKRGEVGRSACGTTEPVIVTFDDFDGRQAPVVGIDELTICVFI